MYEPLTGLASRQLFEDRTRQAFARAARERWSTAVFAINIDRFARINERFGHAAGDDVLREVARRLEACLRSYDNVARSLATVARLGGDRFLAMCEKVPDHDAAGFIAARISAAFEEPLEIGPVSVSIGVVLAAPGHFDVDGVVLEAEAALRQAKSHGAGTIVLFTEAMRLESSARTDLVDDLRRALDEREFVLHYQPKILLANERIAGVEALVRWNHPSMGVVPPDRFIPLAEETGLIVELGAWVLEEACRQAQRWRAVFVDRPQLVMAVNVSSAQFEHGLVAKVADILDRTGVPPNDVCLELTESLVMADVDSAVLLLTQLKDLGVTVSIDDFGTGYSSLAYLRRLPIDELKIDRSFIDGLGQDPEDTAIVAGLVAMAHALGLRVVAEGVETREQLDRLHVLGCEQAQGFYFSRPVPAQALERLLDFERTSVARRHGTPEDDPSSYPHEVIVLADDDPEVRQLAKVSLVAAGYEVREAEDGQEAIELATAARPTCVVVDVQMPHMNGIEACQALRSDAATANCTIVMLTSASDAADKVDAFAAGADDYIVKPFTPRALVDRVRAAIARRNVS